MKHSATYSQSIFTAERYDADIQRYREKRKFDPPVVERSPNRNFSRLSKSPTINTKKAVPQTKAVIVTPQAMLPRLVYENADLEVLRGGGEHKKQLSLTEFTRKVET